MPKLEVPNEFCTDAEDFHSKRFENLYSSQPTHFGAVSGDSGHHICHWVPGRQYTGNDLREEIKPNLQKSYQEVSVKPRKREAYGESGRREQHHAR